MLFRADGYFGYKREVEGCVWVEGGYLWGRLLYVFLLLLRDVSDF